MSHPTLHLRSHNPAIFDRARVLADEYVAGRDAFWAEWPCVSTVAPGSGSVIDVRVKTEIVPTAADLPSWLRPSSDRHFGRCHPNRKDPDGRRFHDHCNERLYATHPIRAFVKSEGLPAESMTGMSFRRCGGFLHRGSVWLALPFEAAQDALDFTLTDGWETVDALTYLAAQEMPENAS